jgi:hypothetical protein
MRYYKIPIAKGYQIYTDFEVAGLLVSGNRENFLDFIKGENHAVLLEREPNNLYDKYAIRVMAQYDEGVNATAAMAARRITVLIGHVPKVIAEALQVTGLYSKIQPRLNAASEPGESWLSIKIDLFGPKDKVLLTSFFEYFESKQAISTITFKPPSERTDSVMTGGNVTVEERRTKTLADVDVALKLEFLDEIAPATLSNQKGSSKNDPLKTPTDFLNQIGEIVGADPIDGRILVDFRWDNYSEANTVLVKLKMMVCSVKLLGHELSLIYKELRRLHRDELVLVAKVAFKNDYLFSVDRRVTLQFIAGMRRDIRTRQQDALAAYDDAKALVETVNLKLRSINAQVRSSPEYLSRRAKADSNRSRLNGHYFVKVSDDMKGPLTAEQVSGLILAGVINRENYVRVDGIDAWILISDIDEIG